MTVFDYTGTIQTETIEVDGTYEITALGARGGFSRILPPGEGTGGKGAQISGDIFLTAGTVLDIVVGGVGGDSLTADTSNFFGGPGGGGGSFVFEQGPGGDVFLAIAGGGGGGGSFDGGIFSPSFAGQTGPTGANGGDAFGGGPGAGGANGAAGAGGTGTLGDTNAGGGGGGYTGGVGGGGGNGLLAGTTFAGGQGDTGNSGGNGGFGGGGGGAAAGGGGGGFGGGGGGSGAYYNAGGGGGSYDADLTNVIAESGVQLPDGSGNGEVSIEPLCFLAGTRIITLQGEVPVESLSPGDFVATRFGGMQKIRWIGRQSYGRRFIAGNRARMPVCISAGALGGGLPMRDLFVSPGHSMLLGETLVLAQSLVNGITIRRDEAPEDVQYYQIELESHDCVMAAGSWSESFADGPGLRAQFHNAASFYALYPDYQEPAALRLCAPRPTEGPALAAALRPVVELARAQCRHGQLHGSIDALREGRIIDGWAQDTANPQLPVLLDVRLGEEHLGQVLACAYREDLAEAGLGLGQCSFSFAAPRDLDGADLTGLSVRRVQDGAPIAPSEPFCMQNHIPYETGQHRHVA